MVLFTIEVRIVIEIHMLAFQLGVMHTADNDHEERSVDYRRSVSSSIFRLVVNLKQIVMELNRCETPLIESFYL